MINVDREVVLTKQIYKGRGAWRDYTIKVTASGHLYRLNKHDEWIEIYGQMGKPLCVLVLETFVGPKPTPKHECCHRDDDRSNNAVENLYWGTHAENMRDIVKNHPEKARKPPRSKRICGVFRILSSEEETKVRELYASGYSRRVIALMLKTTHKVIWRVTKETVKL
jgi:hypothetical protein